MSNVYNKEDLRVGIIDYIKEFTENHGYAPSFRDIKSGCDISSTSVVSYHLDILEERGWVTRDPNVARSIRIMI